MRSKTLVALGRIVLFKRERPTALAPPVRCRKTARLGPETSRASRPANPIHDKEHESQPLAHSEDFLSRLLKGKRIGVTTAGSLTDWLVREPVSRSRAV
jgi:hypothetical protein